jgi:hypothetical protein
MGRRPVADWDAVFAWMVSTGRGQAAAAAHFELRRGTVLAAVDRERRHAGQGRLQGWSPVPRGSGPLE